jgi:N4-gp56 family major capsid protein
MHRFPAITESFDLPLKSGKTVQMYRYDLLGANTTPSAEGVIGNSVPQTTSTVSATVSEYSDFTSGSTLLVETDISQTETEHADNLGYRAGLTNDTLARTEFDSNVASVGYATEGATFSTVDVRKQKALLMAINVRPRDNGEWAGILHPYITFDLKADNTAGGFIEVQKYANPESMMSGEIGKVDNVRFVESTNVGTTGAAPNVQYYTYIAGKGGVGQVSLAGRGASQVVDPSRQNFRVAVVRGGQPSIYDPEGKIGFVASYRFVNVFQTLDSTNYRYGIVKADASLV